VKVYDHLLVTAHLHVYSDITGHTPTLSYLINLCTVLLS